LQQSPKKYIFKLGSRHHYVLLLNTGFAVGRYAPIDIQDINISIGKEKSRAAAMVEVVKHLESVSQWKKL
jgi:hypothetical protein